jgi:hypothetical protein
MQFCSLDPTRFITIPPANLGNEKNAKRENKQGGLGKREKRAAEKTWCRKHGFLLQKAMASGWN